jgi:TonB family protein
MMGILRKYWPWMVSLLFHIVVIGSLSKPAYSTFSKEEIREVKYLESLPPKVNPKIQKLTKKPAPPPPPPSEKVVLKPEKPEIEIPVPSIAEPTSPEPQIELKEVLEVAEMQAKIDLKSLEPAAELEGIDKLIVVKGGGKSTEEILEAPPIPKISLKEGGEVVSEGGIWGGEGKEGGVVLTTRGPEISGIEPISPPKEEKVSKLKLPQKKGSKLPQVELVGPITKRKILNKVLPPYPEWARRRGIFGTVSIKFWVRPDGTVKDNFFILHSSGSPELDRLVQEALKGWRFEPLPQGVDEVQWGIITIIFELE